METPTEGRGTEDEGDGDLMKDRDDPDPKVSGHEEKLPGVWAAGSGLQGLATGLLEPKLSHD